MATGVPIVASDLPSLREVVSDKEVFFATPDDPVSFARTIEYIKANSDEAQVRADRAKALVQKYSWDVRSDKIISSFS